MGLKFDLPMTDDALKAKKAKDVEDKGTKGAPKPEMLPGGGFHGREEGDESMDEDIKKFCEETLAKVEELSKKVNSIERKLANHDQMLISEKEATARKIDALAEELDKVPKRESIWERINPKPDKPVVVYRLVAKNENGDLAILADFADKKIAEGALAIAKSEGKMEPEVLELMVWKNTDGSIGRDMTLDDYVKIHKE